MQFHRCKFTEHEKVTNGIGNVIFYTQAADTNAQPVQELTDSGLIILNENSKHQSKPFKTYIIHQ